MPGSKACRLCWWQACCHDAAAISVLLREQDRFGRITLLNRGATDEVRRRVGQSSLISFWRKRRLNLALEGGGAHGAFTWGVLDRLLEEETLDVGWISGTSAGAVNAVAVAAGLAEGGRAAARAKLRAVWEAVAKAGVPDLLRINPWLAGISKSNAVAQMASLFSPYDFNPLNFDPFRKLLEAHVDFAQLRASAGPELLIAATDVATGLPRLFRRREMTRGVRAGLGLPAHHPPRRDHRRACLLGRRLLGQSRPA